MGQFWVPQTAATRADIVAMATLPCSFAHQVGAGGLEMHWRARTWVSPACALTLRPLPTLRKCLRGRTLTFIGDSVVRDFAMAIASHLAGVPIEAAEERSLGQPNWKPEAWEGVHPARRGIMRALLNESARNKKTDGSRGVYTDGAHDWTVRAFHDVPRAVHWGGRAGIRHILRELRVRRDTAFVQLGIHDTNSRISELGSASTRWKAEPEERWVHGPVFQPYLDHWCERSAAGGRVGGGQHASPPLVWMTANEQCKEKKPRKWRYQAEIVRSINRASVAAAAAAGTPLLDYSRLWRNETERCKATTDGVHSRQWVEHLKAAILLSYLCTEQGHFRGLGAESVSAPFNRTAARC